MAFKIWEMSYITYYIYFAGADEIYFKDKWSRDAF